MPPVSEAEDANQTVIKFAETPIMSTVYFNFLNSVICKLWVADYSLRDLHSIWLLLLLVNLTSLKTRPKKVLKLEFTHL